MRLGGTLDLLLDLVYPRYCLLCESRISREPFRGVCSHCMEGLGWGQAELCPHCGVPAPEKSGCSSCMERQFAFASVWSFGPYQDHLKKLIHAFKFERDRALGRDIARFMAGSEALLEILRGARALVPVPMHPLKERNRGYNQAKILAEELSEITGVPVLRSALAKAKTSVPQMELGKQARWNNVAESFQLGSLRKSAIEGGEIVLVDDVLTTGATAHHCAQVLLRAGARRVRVVVVARTVLN